MDRVLIQVLQWADPIPMSRKGSLGSTAMSQGWGHDTDYFLVQEFLFELAGGSRVYVSRAILIKCEPTSSNSTLLQVSN